MKYTPIETEMIKEKKRIEKLINKEYHAFNKKFAPCGLAWARVVSKIPPFRWEIVIDCSISNERTYFPNCHDILRK